MPPLAGGSKLTTLDWISAICFETDTGGWVGVWASPVKSSVWTISADPILKVTADFIVLLLGSIRCFDPRGALGI